MNTRKIWWTTALLLYVSLSVLPAQDDSDALPSTSFPKVVHVEDFSSVNDAGEFAGWATRHGEKLKIAKDDFVDGPSSAVVDAREAESSNGFVFSTSTWKFESQELLGQRVRFSAWVKTADVSSMERVVLMIRSSRTREDGSNEMVSFDNMGSRPIRSAEWKKYDLVIDVTKDCDSVEAGVAVLGQAKCWIDSAKIEIVGSDVETTGTTRRSQVSAPFFTPWLWLVGLALLMFSLAHIEECLIQKFCLRFSIVYWVLYLFQWLFALITGMIQTVASLIGNESTLQWARWAYDGWHEVTSPMAQWTATNVLRIEGEVKYIPGGSGDTTFEYVHMFNCFVVAFLIGALWTALPRLKSNANSLLRDLHRSHLRYCLAACLLSYGLAKAGFVSTQFAPSGTLMEGQLTRTYGESSPMGLLWTFMGASPMYTFFAGLMEVVPAVLLLFRRTMALGAAMAFAVMLNVFMLNVCYDVPVKQLSFHLSMAALLVLLPEVPRIVSVFFLNRAVEPSSLVVPVWVESRSMRWLLGTIKCAVVLLVFAFPIGQHVWSEVTHEHTTEETEHALLKREFRWISEAPDNR